MQNFVCNEGQQLLLQMSAKAILKSRNTVIFLSGGSALQSKLHIWNVQERLNFIGKGEQLTVFTDIPRSK